METGKRSGARWLGLGALLLVAAALLLSLGEAEPKPTERKQIAFPDGPGRVERERALQRATLVLPARPASPVAAVEEPVARRDPFLVALPVKPDQPTVVFEANALRHSRLGERVVACVLDKDPAMFREIERETGIDVLKDVDRVGLAGDAVVVSGFFDRARFEALTNNPQLREERYGEAGRIWSPVRPNEPTVGAWRDQLILLAATSTPIRQAMDQLEGRADAPATGIPEDMAYGEVYGVVPGAMARRLLPPGERALADRVAAAATRIELHLDAMNDLAAVVRVHGSDDAAMEDLARTLGAGLAVARVQAQATSDEPLADLLEQARVVRVPGSFSVEAAMPADRLDHWFGTCGAGR
jgi:hypothetical protein